MNLLWICKTFTDLTSHELYAILRLRSEIFVVEQNCVYQDIDNKDRLSFHVMGWAGSELVAYSRLLPSGVSFEEISIGRVIIKKSNRGAGIGKILMQKSISKCYEIFDFRPIKIGAQLYLKKFYESLGFEQCSESYDEDGIDHIEMITGHH